jgi:hypothetical protein
MGIQFKPRSMRKQTATRVPPSPDSRGFLMQDFHSATSEKFLMLSLAWKSVEAAVGPAQIRLAA